MQAKVVFSSTVVSTFGAHVNLLFLAIITDAPPSAKTATEQALSAQAWCKPKRPLACVLRGANLTQKNPRGGRKLA